MEKWLITEATKGKLGKLTQCWLLNVAILEFPVSYNTDAQWGSCCLEKPQLWLSKTTTTTTHQSSSTPWLSLCKHGFPCMEFAFLPWLFLVTLFSIVSSSLNKNLQVNFPRARHYPLHTPTPNTNLPGPTLCSENSHFVQTCLFFFLVDFFKKRYEQASFFPLWIPSLRLIDWIWSGSFSCEKYLLIFPCPGGAGELNGEQRENNVRISHHGNYFPLTMGHCLLLGSLFNFNPYYGSCIFPEWPREPKTHHF